MAVARQADGPMPRNEVQARALEQGIDLARVPRHVAMIMDGNGRWARAQGWHRLAGHRQGYATLRDVLLLSSKLGVEYLTVYAFSVENWRRPDDEVVGLMSLIEEAARHELGPLRENNVRVLVSGRVGDLPENSRAALDDLVQSTADNTGITFVLAINYGGRAEIVDAVREIVAEGLRAEDVTEETVAARLYTPQVPEPDLMIRTAGEMRWSNFLLWQAAYAELFVTATNWPDFGEEDLFKAVLSYQSRDRKFGKTIEQCRPVSPGS